MDIVPGVMTYARHYVEVMNWPIFVLGRGKTTLANCRDCAVAGSPHDREACACLTCHGFYAATKDLVAVERMLRVGLASGGGMLALRTGRASGITVIDAESSGDVVDDGRGGTLVTGLQVIDEEWEQWVGEDVDQLPTLTALTASGGKHLLYATGNKFVRSRNRVLPGVDIKADGGYVALPCGLDARCWLTDGRPSTPMPPGAGMLEWLKTAKGNGSYLRRSTGNAAADRVSSHWGGDTRYDFDNAYQDGAREGERDLFFRDLIFRLRMGGHDLDYATQQVHAHWLRCEQPSETNGVKWLMPWEHVQYKIDHAWRTLTPFSKEERMRQQDWARKIVGRGSAVTPSE